VRKYCNAHDDVYLNSDLSVGQIAFYFEHAESLSLNRFQFAQNQSPYLSSINYSNYKYSSNYSCKTDFVESDSVIDGI